MDVLHINNDSNQSEESKIEMPNDFTGCNLLQKVYLLKGQIQILCRCTSELYLTPAPFVKTIKPGQIFRLLKYLSKIRMAQLSTALGHENKVVLAAMPEVYDSFVKLMNDFLRFAAEDLTLYLPNILEFIAQLFTDIRQTGGIQQTGEKPFATLKNSLHELLESLCDIFGAGVSIEKYADEIIPFVISDFLPANETITLNITGGVNSSLSKKQKKTSQQAAGMNLLNREAKKRVTNSLTVASSLKALASVLNSSGTFLSESCHRSIQACVIGTCMDVQRSGIKGRPIPFNEPECRSSLYQALYSLLSNPHPKTPAPFRHAFGIFRHGHLNDRHPRVQDVCLQGNIS